MTVETQRWRGGRDPGWHPIDGAGGARSDRPDALASDDADDVEYEGPGPRASILPVPAQDEWISEIDGDDEVRDEWVDDSADDSTDSLGDSLESVDDALDPVDLSIDGSGESLRGDDSWSDGSEDSGLVDVVFDVTDPLV